MGVWGLGRVVLPMLGCVVLTACGGTVAGTAESDGRWDPCSIPAEEIEATGLDSSSMERDWGESDISTPDWSLCTYKGPSDVHSYFFIIKSSNEHSLSESRNNSSYVNGVALTIGARNGYRYETQISNSVVDCNVAVEITPGVAVFSVTSMGRMAIGADPCVLVEDHAIAFEKFLPST